MSDRPARVRALVAPALRPDGTPLDWPPASAGPRANPWIRLGAFIGTAVVIFTIMLGVMLVLGPDRSRRDGPVIVSLTLILLALVSYLVAERGIGGRHLIELAGRRWTGVLGGAALGIVLIASCTLAIALLGGYRVDGLTAPSPALLAGTILQAGFQAAIFEEIVFRGVLFRYVEAALGSWVALGLSALLFGFGHLGNPHSTIVGAVAIAIEAGLLFGTLYVVTRSLWVVMGVHFAWNLMEAFAGIQVSGTTQAAFLRSHPAGSTLISGGDFGIEASVVTVVLLGALSVWLMARAHRQGLIVRPFWVRRRRAAQTAGAVEPTHDVNPEEMATPRSA